MVCVPKYNRSESNKMFYCYVTKIIANFIAWNDGVLSALTNPYIQTFLYVKSIHAYLLLSIFRKYIYFSLFLHIWFNFSTFDCLFHSVIPGILGEPVGTPIAFIKVNFAYYSQPDFKVLYFWATFLETEKRSVP